MEAGLPQHTHAFSYTAPATGSLITGTGIYQNFHRTVTTSSGTTVGASDPIYGKSNTVTPLSQKVIYLIRY